MMSSGNVLSSRDERKLSADAAELCRIADQLPLLTSYFKEVPNRWRMEPGGSLFLGVGLGNRVGPTLGLPFDVAGFLATAATLRDELGLSRVLVLVADTHSLENAWADEATVLCLGDLIQQSLERLWAGLRLGPVRFTRGSDLEATTDYRALLEEIPPHVDGAYVRREIADIEWHRLRYGATVKLGWTVDPSGRAQTNGDERPFDTAYREVFGDAVAMVYTEAGRRDDAASPRCSPYALLTGEARLPLDPSTAAVSLPSSEEHREYLERSVAAVERHIGTCADDLPARIERIRRLTAGTQSGRLSRSGAAREAETSVLEDLESRGLIADCTDVPGLRQRLAQKPIRVYCGFDPTADSLHVGSLKALHVLELFRRHGHQPILVIGGGTGFIRDPAASSTERGLPDTETLGANSEALRAQLMRLLPPAQDLPGALIVDNREWLSELRIVDFLRETGMHFRLNHLLGKESVRRRLDSQAGLSFAELSYMLLQANDFAVLQRELGCELQIGGSDQWGNITAGVELIRRAGGAPAFGLVWPLLDKADGREFGKTTEGNVWLDGARTSPFAFYQFWVNADDDDDVETLLMQFTFLSVTEIGQVLAEHRRAPELRIAQRRLAREVTEWVHGPSEAQAAEQASRALFSEGGRNLTGDALALLEREMPTSHVSMDQLESLQTIGELAATCGLASSKAEARRLIASGGLYLNGERVTQSSSWRPAAAERGWMILRKGRRHHRLVRVDQP